MTNHGREECPLNGKRKMLFGCSGQDIGKITEKAFAELSRDFTIWLHIICNSINIENMHGALSIEQEQILKTETLFGI